MLIRKTRKGVKQVANAKLIQSLLNELNKKSGRKWSLAEIAALSRGLGAKDLQDQDKMRQLIQKLSAITGNPMSAEQANQLASKMKDSSFIKKQFKK